MSKYKVNSVLINDDRVIKKNNKRVLDLYKYLSSRGFYNYPDVINSDEDKIESKYVSEEENYELIKGSELIKTVSMLHNKTIEYKDTSKNKYRKIYEDISSNIEYLKQYYENIIKEIEEEVYMSPSHYLFARNYSIIDSSLKYSKSNLKSWFNTVKNKSKERVCIIHNNLSLKHFIKGDKNYLLSFDNYLVDTPILDLYKFYKNEGYKLDFSSLIKLYEETNKLENEERNLLNVLISIPPRINMCKDEYLNCKNIKTFLEYMYSSMHFVNMNK